MNDDILKAVVHTSALRDALKALDVIPPEVRAAHKIARQLEQARPPQLEAAIKIARDLEAVRPAFLDAATGYTGGQSPYVGRAGSDLELDDAPSRAVSTPPRTRLSSVSDLGQAVRSRRMLMSLTQQELADAAGVGRRFVSELEGGKPTLEIGKVIQVCGFVGLDLFVEAR